MLSLSLCGEDLSYGRRSACVENKSQTHRARPRPFLSTLSEAPRGRELTKRERCDTLSGLRDIYSAYCSNRVQWVCGAVGAFLAPKLVRLGAH